MNKVDTSNETSTLWSVEKVETRKFLQDANIEAFKHVILKNIGSTYDPTKVYVLYGVANSTSPSTYTISAGAVFYSGEIFTVDAVTFTAVNTAVAKIVTTNDPVADPTLFSDNATRNIHNIRKVVISDAVSGTGIADFANFIPLSVVSTNSITTNTSFSTTTTLHTITPSTTFGTSQMQVDISTTFQNGSSTAVTITLKKNGAALRAWKQTVASTAFYSLAYSTIISYAANDVLTVVITSDSGGTINYSDIIAKSL
jgi:hypothetical protein